MRPRRRPQRENQGKRKHGGVAVVSDRALASALHELDRIRAPLFRELARLIKAPDYLGGEPAHVCCTRERNQMRISPLEAEALARAFRSEPELRAKLPQVLKKIRAELEGLADGTHRQNFDCPLLDGVRCLVHDVAKPIGCTAWNPGRDFTDAGWTAFAQRDELNDRVFGNHWKLRVIPLWLKRVLARELAGAGPPAATSPGPPAPRPE